MTNTKRCPLCDVAPEFRIGMLNMAMGGCPNAKCSLYGTVMQATLRTAAEQWNFMVGMVEASLEGVR